VGIGRVAGFRGAFRELTNRREQLWPSCYLTVSTNLMYLKFHLPVALINDFICRGNAVKQLRKNLFFMMTL
jgi:hypothetical protein